MASWSDLFNLPVPMYVHLTLQYGIYFPMEMRDYLDNWLADRFKQNMPNDKFTLSFVSQKFLEDLLVQLDLTISNLSWSDHFKVKTRLREVKKYIQEYYSHNPISLYTHLRNCYEYEQKLLNDENNEHVYVTKNLDAFISYLKEIDNKIVISNSSSEITVTEPINYINDCMIPNGDKNMKMSTILSEIVENVKKIQECVLMKYLQEWNKNQKYSEFEDKNQRLILLNQLQMWYEKLLLILKSLKKQIEFIRVYQQEPLPFILKDVEDLFDILITKSLVIEDQPPQIIMSKHKFEAKVRFLPSKVLNIATANSKISIKIISEAQLQTLHETNSCTQFCGTIKYDSEILNNGNTIHLTNILLNKIKRSSRNGSRSVVEQKYALLFQFEVEVCDGQSIKKCYLWTYSLPIVVIVHSSQVPDAMGTILWSSAFVEHDRMVPNKVSWDELGKVLNKKFHKETGRSLTDENLQFLYEKILRKRNFPQIVYENSEVTWEEFAKLEIYHSETEKFTFWTWFYRVMNLTKMYLKKLWCDGRIIGFVSEAAERQILNASSVGAFLLRFSDDILGSILIVTINNHNQIEYLGPITADTLCTHSLEEIILDLRDLTYLHGRLSNAEDNYSGHKNLIFKYISEIKQSEDGKKYVPIIFHAKLLRTGGQ